MLISKTHKIITIVTLSALLLLALTSLVMAQGPGFGHQEPTIGGYYDPGYSPHVPSYGYPGSGYHQPGYGYQNPGYGHQNPGYGYQNPGSPSYQRGYGSQNSGYGHMGRGMRHSW